MSNNPNLGAHYPFAIPLPYQYKTQTNYNQYFILLRVQRVQRDQLPYCMYHLYMMYLGCDGGWLVADNVTYYLCTTRHQLTLQGDLTNLFNKYVNRLQLYLYRNIY